MLGDAIGPQGQTPVSITRVFTAEMVKVVWPDGVESEVKTTPLSSALALSTPSVAFHFERPTAKVVDLESPRVEAKTGVLAEPPARRSEPILWQAGDRRQVWLLAVGVGQYRDERVPMLPFATGDTEQVCRWFSGLASQRVSQEKIRVLVNEQATRQNLLEQIDWLRKQALPEDAVFVYFAGHGAPELAPDGKSVDAKYLLLYDTDPNQLFATGFSLDDLTRKLEAVKAKAQVVILEACYSGPMGQEILKKTPTADLEIRPRLIQEMGERSGRVILSASSGRQVAIGVDEIKGGLFTHYLLNAWGDGSRRLLSDCFDDAREQVRRAANRLGSTQEPAKFGDRNLDILFR